MFPCGSIYVFICTILLGLIRNGSSSMGFKNMILNYDLHEKPQNTGPALVNVSVILHSIDINVVGQSLLVTAEVVQEWEDRHLQYFQARRTGPRENDIGLYGARLEMAKSHIWTPDLIPAGPVNLDYPSNGEFMRFNPFGFVTWTQLIVYETPCTFLLGPYPLGYLMCEVKFHSSGFSVEELAPSWMSSNAIIYDQCALPPGYIIYQVIHEDGNAAHISRARKQLIGKIYFRYDYGHHVKHTIVPMSACVATAYLAFFLSGDNMAARMSTVGLSFVMAAVFHEGSYLPAPKVPYTMALEVFTGACLTFIWLVGVESVVVDNINGMVQRNNGPYSLENTDGVTNRRVVLVSIWLDRVFRILYPIAFIIFNGIFWVTYSSAAFSMVQ